MTGRGGDAALRERLRDVYWIGGGSGAGKSTVARRLADRLREEAGRLALPVIEVDTAMTEDGLVERVAKGFGR